MAQIGFPTGPLAIRPRAFLAFAAACFALWLAVLSLQHASGTAPIAAPETGLALGGLLIGGRRLWPAILVGAAAAYLLGPSDLSFPTVAVLVLTQTAAAWAGAALFDVRRADSASIALEDAPLIAQAGIVAGVVASLGVLAAGAAPPSALAAILGRNAVGILIMVPLLVSWSGTRWSQWRAARLVHLAAIALAVAGLVAGVSFGDGTEVIAWSLFPVLVWSALAFQRRGATLALAILAAGLTAGTAFGRGPFGASNPLGGAAFGQICIAVVTVTLLVLAERADARQSEARRREAVRRLYERDEQLALFVDNVPSAVAILDNEMRYIAASRRYRGDCEIPADVVLTGRSHYAIFPDLPARWRGIYNRVLAGEELSNPEEHWLKSDGKTAIVRWKMKPWRDREGQIAGLMLFIEVVTEAVESRRRIEAAEARYRGVFDQAPVGVARLSLEGRYLDVNDRACEILGRERTELEEGDFTQFLPPGDLPADIDAAREMIMGVRRSYAVEKRIDARDGGAEWIHLTTSLIRNSEGAPECFVAVIQDITERKRAETRLRESEARLRLAQEAAGVGVWEMDIDRRVVIHSPLSLRMHRLPDAPDGVITFEDLATHFDADLGEDVTNRVRRAVREGEPYDVTFRLEMHDGSERWLHSFGRHEPRPGGVGLIRGASIDITAFRQSEARLVEAHEKLLRLSRLGAMGAMASTLAHELNQPLTAVANYTQGCHLLLSSGTRANDDTLIEMLARASGEALRAGAIVRKIREFTISGDISREPEDLRAMIADAWDRERGPDSGVQLTTEFGPGVAAIAVDRLQMEQVFTNLMRNAFDAMADGPIRQLRIEANESDGGILIRFRDSGPGIGPDVLANLFDPFRTTKSNGMGLGLAICRTIVEAHGGRLWAENIARGGSAFNILLPLPGTQGESVHEE